MTHICQWCGGECDCGTPEDCTCPCDDLEADDELDPGYDE